MLARLTALAPLALVVVGTVLAIAGSGLLGRGPIPPVEVRVLSASDFEFEPTTVSVPAGARVNLTFRNDSSEPHTLIMLEPIALNSGRLVHPGEVESLEFVAPSAGSYTFVCNVHEGMVGTLLVP